MMTQRTSSLKQKILLPGISGLLLLLCFPTFSLWPLAFIAWVPLLISLEKKSGWDAFQSGWLTGILFFGFLIYWLNFVSGIAYTLLVLYLSVYPAIFCTLYVKLKNSKTRPLWGGLIWTILEYLRSSGPFSFAWGLMGHTQWNMPWLAYSASWWGVYGLSFLLMALNIGLAEIWLERQKRNQVISADFSSTLKIDHLWPLIILIGIACAGAFHESYSPDQKLIRIALVQGNFNQDEKWDVSVSDTVDTYLRLSSEALSQEPDLVVWPETAIPDILTPNSKYWDQLEAWVLENQTPLLLGAVGKHGDDYLNSAFFVAPGKNSSVTWQQYNKIHLVPYGESVPFQEYLPFLKRMVESRGGGEYLPGSEFPVFEVKGIRFGILICFESTLAPFARRYAEQEVDFLVVITNDAWFLRSTAPYQHAIQSTFRAIETGVPVVRATNTGWTCAFDAAGRLLDSIPIYEENVLTLDIKTRHRSTLYSSWGDFLMLLIIGITLGYYIASIICPNVIKEL